MKTQRSFLVLLILIASACNVMAPAPTPTPVPLPPPQHLEGAFQWLESHALLKDNVDWAALRLDTTDLIASAKTTKDTVPAICMALRGLKDGNAWLWIPDLEVPNFYSGYSALYPENEVIFNIEPGSPAEKAGLHVGDLIAEVDGAPPERSSSPMAPDYPPCNVKPLDSNAEQVITLNRGGQSFQVKIQRTNNAGEDRYFPPRGERLGTEAHGIGYVELTTDGGHPPYPGAVQKLMKAMDKPPVCGWVIDLRRNLGGDIWSYIAAVGPILGEGELGGFEYTDGTREGWAYRDGQVFWNNEYRDESKVDGSIYKPKRTAPAALLVSPATQAAGELLLIAFQGRPDTRSFGEPTRGLPTLVTHTDLSDGSRLFVSGADSFDRSGRIYSSSIPPDVIVTNDWSKFGTDQDPVIVEAMKWLQSQSSCTR